MVKKGPYDLVRVTVSVSVKLGSTAGNQLVLPRGAYESLTEEDLRELLLDYMLKTKHIEVKVVADDRPRAGQTLY